MLRRNAQFFFEAAQGRSGVIFARFHFFRGGLIAKTPLPVAKLLFCFQKELLTFADEDLNHVD